MKPLKNSVITKIKITHPYNGEVYFDMCCRPFSLLISCGVPSISEPHANKFIKQIFTVVNMACGTICADSDNWVTR